jgi:hypothetical protein
VSFNENDTTALDAINPKDNVGNTSTNKIWYLELFDLTINRRSHPLPSSQLSFQPQEKQQEIQNLIPTAVIYSVKILGVSIGDFFYHDRSYRFKGIEFALYELKGAFNSLQKLKLIKVIGSLHNEKRYTISDDSLQDFFMAYGS